MFFLLASFMMVSLSQVHMKGMKVELPTGVSGKPNTKRITSVSRSIATGTSTSTKKKMEIDELHQTLSPGAPGQSGRENFRAR